MKKFDVYYFYDIVHYMRKHKFFTNSIMQCLGDSAGVAVIGGGLV
jgi:hypothetical protein